VVISTFEKRPSQRQAINELPLYPTETVLFDENMVPSINYTGQVSALNFECKFSNQLRRQQQFPKNRKQPHKCILRITQGQCLEF
jgi:hypothetical protein